MSTIVVWFGWQARIGRIGFYLLFGLSVTASVQLVGVYLVFATLIIPALATRHAEKHALLKAYAVAALGYAVGLSLSAFLDLPSGAVVVWALAAAGTTCLRWKDVKTVGRKRHYCVKLKLAPHVTVSSLMRDATILILPRAGR